MTVEEWRNKNHKCAWCIHCISRVERDVGVVCVCNAKRKRVNTTILRPFCRLFEQETEHIPIDEKEVDFLSKLSPEGRELYYKIVYPEREE